MGDMSAQAVGGYLQGLIDLQPQLTAASVSASAGVNANYIWRLKNGEIKKPSSEVVGALVKSAHGDIEEATRLLLDKEATYQDGIDRATSWIARQSREAQEQIAEMQARPAEDRQELSAILRRLADLVSAGYSPQAALRRVAAESELGALGRDGPEARPRRQGPQE